MLPLIPILGRILASAVGRAAIARGATSAATGGIGSLLRTAAPAAAKAAAPEAAGAGFARTAASALTSQAMQAALPRAQVAPPPFSPPVVPPPITPPPAPGQSSPYGPERHQRAYHEEAQRQAQRTTEAQRESIQPLESFNKILNSPAGLISSLSLLNRSARDLNAGFTESTRTTAKYSGEIQTALAAAHMADIRRDMRSARATSQTIAWNTRAQSRVDDAQRPWQDLKTNIGNAFGAMLDTAGAAVLEKLNHLTNIEETLKRAFPEGDAQGRMAAFVTDMAKEYRQRQDKQQWQRRAPGSTEN